MGIYKYEEAHDPWWSEMSNFLATIREGKPVIAPLEIGVADARSVIYGNRAVETGQKVFWPKKQESGVRSQKSEEKVSGFTCQV
jgi:hypothetical protein